MSKNKLKAEISNPDKILFPKSKITKQDLIDYYIKVSNKMIPLAKDRPLTMHRFPNGINKEGFYQKNISDFFPSWVKTAKIKRKEDKGIEMVLCNDLDTLVYITNLACITPHIWPSRRQKPNYPDRMIFDLDPSGKNFGKVKEAAFDLKEILEKKLGLKTFLMLTGSKGLHVVVPIKPLMTFDEVRKFAKNIALLLSREKPKKYTTEQRKESRKGKLFIDYLRNGYAQMAVAPYAVRAIEKGPIAIPIEWKELSEPRCSSQKFNISNISSRLKKACPWARIDKNAKSLKGLIKKLDKLYEES